MRSISAKTGQLEKVSHETAARPFSIHRTFVGGENPNALYIHCHPEAEFFFLEEGNVSFCVENENFDLCGGDAVFVPPYVTHNADKEPGKACRYNALVFSLEWLSGYAGGEGNLYVDTLLENRMESLMVFRHGDAGHKEVLERLSHFKTYADLPIHQYEMRLVGEMLMNLQEIYNAVTEKIMKREKTDASREGIRKAVDYLMRHFDEHISLDLLAEQSGYSESHFCHRFKTVTGYAPVAFLNRVRVIKATERLIISDDKITKIAADCGFDNISYFNRVFKGQMEMSPGEYRSRGKQHRREYCL